MTLISVKRLPYMRLMMLLLTMVGILLQCGTVLAQAAPGVAARVNKVPISNADLEQAIDAYIPPGSFHGSVGGAKRDEYRKPALDLLIEREILYQEAKARGMGADDREADKSLEAIKKQFKDKKAFDKALKDAGLSLKEYRAIVKRNVIIEKLLKSEVEDKSKYTDRQVEDYYNANKEKFVRPEAMRIRHILLKTAPLATDKEKKEIGDKATDVLRRAKAGEDFGELASRYSDDDYRIKGGDLGWVHKGRLEPEVEKAAEKLSIGGIAMTETLSGYHIIKMEEKKPSRQLSFDEVKESLKKDLEAKRSLEVKTALMESLRKKARIEIY